MGFRKKGSVSLWLCLKMPSDPDHDPLKSEFGIEYYNLDDLEPVGTTDGTTRPVQELISQLSFSKSFGEPALAQAQRLSIDEACLAIALFDFAYNPKQVSVQLPNDPKFLGVFEWNDDE